MFKSLVLYTLQRKKARLKNEKKLFLREKIHTWRIIGQFIYFIKGFYEGQCPEVFLG